MRDPFAITAERRAELVAGATAEAEKLNDLIRAQLGSAPDRWAELLPKLIAFQDDHRRVELDIEPLLLGELTRPGLEAGREFVRSSSVEQIIALLGRSDERFGAAWLFDAKQPLREQMLGPGEVMLPGVFRRVPIALAARMRFAVADGQASEVRALIRAAMANTRVAGGRLATIYVVIARYAAVWALREVRLLAREGAVSPAELRAWLREIDEGRPRWDLLSMAEAEKVYGREETKQIQIRWADRDVREKEITTLEELRPVTRVLFPTHLTRTDIERRLPPGVTIAALEAGQAEPPEPYARFVDRSVDWLVVLLEAWWGLNADLDATRVVLALEIHKAVHGSYPADLAALDLEPLGGELPQDLLAGGSFVYHLTPAGEQPYELRGSRGPGEAYSVPRGPAPEPVTPSWPALPVPEAPAGE